MTENIKATWDISLYTECPKCKHDFDILDSDSDFWGNGIQPVEHGTLKSKNYEAMCPECDHEFKVDFEY